MSRQSAGTLSPTETEMMSPGTRAEAWIFWIREFRITLVSSGEYSFKAFEKKDKKEKPNSARFCCEKREGEGGLTSIAFSALVSCITPTVAFAIRINRITAGSTNAVSQSSFSSNKARMKETMAEPRRMRTSWSSNWARMRVMSEVGSSSGRTGQTREENGEWKEREEERERGKG